ncbi:EF-hand domain-containing protein [Winogradskyella psychrotolerans]|uniref:EF-hand domain-containing protein n=1 Tax=Winogradskyella psychrotolerans TaxID=1344585 RepID=UPI001C07B8E4|nr:EF-hand domain-containing protein [Winogradskyella psychrotolerans]MBU2920155.1 EF-hand domain-containing protein [Winogradskyella psychrotolerans]
MITKTLKIGFFIITIASFSLVSAQEKLNTKKDRSVKMFNYLDTNTDDKINLEEFKVRYEKESTEKITVEKLFASADTDANETLDRAEFKIFYEQTQKPKRIENQVHRPKKKVEKKG